MDKLTEKKFNKTFLAGAYDIVILNKNK